MRLSRRKENFYQMKRKRTRKAGRLRGCGTKNLDGEEGKKLQGKKQMRLGFQIGIQWRRKSRKGNYGRNRASKKAKRRKRRRKKKKRPLKKPKQEEIGEKDAHSERVTGALVWRDKELNRK